MKRIGNLLVIGMQCGVIGMNDDEKDENKTFYIKNHDVGRVLISDLGTKLNFNIKHGGAHRISRALIVCMGNFYRMLHLYNMIFIL